MTVDTIRLLFAHACWADDRVLQAAAALSPEEYRRDLRGSMPSLRDTRVHLVGVQALWLARWRGEAPTAIWPASELPDVRSLRARWEPLWEQLSAFVAVQSDATLRSEIRYKNLKGEPMAFPLGPLMLHVGNHSTHHRGQVVTLLRQLGVAPPATDLFLFPGFAR